MHHQRLLARTVFGNIVQTKSLWQVEIELNRRKLPRTADGIDQLHVNLRTVESGFTRHHLVFNISTLQRVLQRAVAQVPLLLGAEKILVVFGIPGGKFSLILVKAEIFENLQGEIHAAYDFVFDLLRSTKNVGIVLSESANPQQTMHYTRTLVAIHRPELSQPDWQVAIRLQRILVNQNMKRTIHG